MAMTHLYSMAYELTDSGDVLIEQDAGCGEVERVSLHPLQVRLIASEMGLLKGDESAWQHVETLERRLRVLRDRIEELDDRLWSVPIYPAGSNADDPDCIYSDATLVLAEEFCADLPCPQADADALFDRREPSEETVQKPMGSRAKTPGFQEQRGLPLSEES